MPHSRTATEFGWKVLRRLAESKLTRKEFCRIHSLSQSRLSEVITGNTSRNTSAFRAKVAKLLEIEECIGEERSSKCGCGFR